MSKPSGYLLNPMIPPWLRPKIIIVDFPNEFLGPWYYFYGRKKGSHREFDPWPPTAPAPKAVRGKRLVVKALESIPLVAP